MKDHLENRFSHKGKDRLFPILDKKYLRIHFKNKFKGEARWWRSE